MTFCSRVILSSHLQVKNNLFFHKRSAGISLWSICYLLSFEWTDNFIHEVGEESGKGNIHHFRWNKARCEGVSCPNLETGAQWPVGILITAVKSDCVDPLTSFYWDDRWGRLLWVVTASGKSIETSVCSGSGFVVTAMPETCKAMQIRWMPVR